MVHFTNNYEKLYVYDMTIKAPDIRVLRVNNYAPVLLCSLRRKKFAFLVGVANNVLSAGSRRIRIVKKDPGCKIFSLAINIRFSQ